MKYPEAPGSKTSGTSTEAADAIAPGAQNLRDQVLSMLATKSMTADECANCLGQSILAVRPRLSELRARGLITDTGERRKNESGLRATVWRAN